MKTFITSDTHFGHRNIIKYCGRPYETVEEMDRDLIHRWNSVVGQNDLVWFLGNFTMGRNAEKYLAQLHGRIHMVLGNHDHKNWWELEVAKKNPKILSARGKTIEQCEGVLLRLKHAPDPDEARKYPKVLFLYGHIHEKDNEPDWPTNMMNVSVERTGYKPVLLADVVNEWKGRKG